MGRRRGRARGGRAAPAAADLGVGAALCCQALGTLDGAEMVKAPTSKRASGHPVAEPGLVTKLTQKKKKKKRFWINKARDASEKPGSNSKVVAVRPPKAPEDFSQNWKALQEVRRAGTPRVHIAHLPRSPQTEKREKDLWSPKSEAGRQI